MNNNDKYKNLKSEVFEYQEEDFMPSLFLWSIIIIVGMVGVLILFGMIVAAIVMIVSGVANAWW